MKKYSGFYVPSETEILSAAAHLVALENGSDNHFDCRFYPENGKFCYGEYIDQHSYTPGNDFIYIPTMLEYRQIARNRPCELADYVKINRLQRDPIPKEIRQEIIDWINESN